MRYRVDDLAARCGVSVDTVRYYQARGLLPRPQRSGRLAFYDDSHVARLERIRELKARGFTLAMVGRALDGALDVSEEALATALAGPLPGEPAPTDEGERLTLSDLARRTGVSLTLLEAIEREGLLVPRGDGEAPYTAADAGAVGAGLALLQAGVPLSELLALARRHDEAMRALADHAVDLFARFVRDPIRGESVSDQEASERMVAALHVMLPAVGEVVAHHFRRRLLAAAIARIADEPGAGAGGGGGGALPAGP